MDDQKWRDMIEYRLLALEARSLLQGTEHKYLITSDGRKLYEYGTKDGAEFAREFAKLIAARADAIREVAIAIRECDGRSK